MKQQYTQQLQGTVILKTTNSFQVLNNRQIYRCSLAGKPGHKLLSTHPIVVGDEVIFSYKSGHLDGEILSVLPRRNQFGRRAANPKTHSHYAKEQIFAANIDLVIPIFALAQPEPSWNMLDRFLVLAESHNIPACICLNKSDCVDLNDGEIQYVIHGFRQIGYPVMVTSANNGTGIPEFQSALMDKTSLFLGKSGVGKTSLLNTIQPGLGENVREVSVKWKQRGRHTTTHHAMFPLVAGGFVIDSPGIRELGLWDILPHELGALMPDFFRFLGKCKFGIDCVHLDEPGCEIRRAVMSGQISPRRYKSYLRMLEEL